jgi:hypothetical protein
MSKASDKKAEKISSLADAIAHLVPDGSSVAMGLCLESMIPFAAGHEIIRQGKRDLTLIGPISDILFDQGNRGLGGQRDDGLGLQFPPRHGGQDSAPGGDH